MGEKRRREESGQPESSEDDDLRRTPPTSRNVRSRQNQQRTPPETPFRRRNLPEKLLVEKQTSHPHLSTQTLQRISLARKVFSLFWRDIFWNFSLVGNEGKETRRTAHGCNAVFEFADRRQINWELSAKDLKAKVAFDMETDNWSAIDYTELLDSSVFSEFWSVVNAYPNHPSHRRDAIKASIATYLALKRSSTLESVLRATFDHHGIEMRDDSGIVQEFCRGNIFCNPEQVVAAVYLTATLSGHSLASWYHRELRDKYMGTLKWEVYSEGKAWVDAVKELTAGHEFLADCEMTETCDVFDD
ncbi:hypothetical protein HDU96_004721, partial [Phlyctochytrium bullatum]